MNGTARPGSGAPHEGAEWGKGRGGVGWLFPAEEIGDWAKALELRGEEGGGDYLQVGGPRGRGSQEGRGDGGGYKSPGPGPGVQTH